MFQLEAEIAGWRHRLAASGSCTGDAVDELESHLRESQAALLASGLTSEEAFLIAARRLGDPESLQAEYAKEHGALPVWRERLYWMLTGFLAIECLIVLAALLHDVGNFSALALGGPGPAMIPLALTFTAAGFAVAACAAYLLRNRLLRGFTTRPTSWVVVAVAFVMVGTVLGQVVMSASVIVIGPPDFAKLAIFRAIATNAFAVFALLALGIIIARLRGRLAT